MQRLLAKTLCANTIMNQKVKAKIKGPSGSDALSVEWLSEPRTDGSIRIGGPVISQIPLSMVPQELRVPNSVVYVSLSDPHTVVEVEHYGSST